MELTQAELDICMGDQPVAVNSLLTADIAAQATCSYKEQIARSVIGQASLSEHIHVEVELKIVG